MTLFRAVNLQEPDLIFGGFHEEKDPRIGLAHFGPYKHQTESVGQDKIRMGIIGDKSMLEKSKQLIQMISSPIQSQAPNRWLYPDFPGVSKESKFGCSIELSTTWQQTILQNEIDEILKILDVNERIGAAVQLYVTKINSILSEDNPPDVVLCTLPSQIELHCGISKFTRGAKTPKPTQLERQIQKFKNDNQKFLSDWGVVVEADAHKKPKGFDLRNSLKGRAMALKTPKPIQLLRESTADAILNYAQYRDENKKGKKQDPSSFAWNFSTALFYKANGKPWRLAKLRQDTCYVGISFYRDKLSFNENIETSMAQIFTHDGQGLVLRGSEVYVDEKTKEAHLSEKQAHDLLTDCIKKYTEKAGRTPARVVVHKPTSFTSVENSGFSSAIGNVKKDFVTILSRKGIRFMRKGSYPVLRGTVISLTPDIHILYSSGYTSRIRTYPGHRIPVPLYLIHKGDSEVQEICDEIMGLTKLNWNTTSFSTFLPITLAFSNKVGDILSECDKETELQNHYRFYM